MSYRESLETLMHEAQRRRASGMPCNPCREPLTDSDWLSLDELNQLHCLGLRAAIAEMQAGRLFVGQEAA